MATQYSISTGTIALVAATAKTCIEIPSGSTAPLTVIALELSFSHTAASSVVVEWGTFTTTGTGTTVTAFKYGMDQGPVAIVGTVKIADTVEPAGFARGTLPSWVFPLPGMYSAFHPYAREMYQPVSTNRALRLTAVGAGNVHINLVFEQ
jgi:hypothetical protein